MRLGFINKWCVLHRFVAFLLHSTKRGCFVRFKDEGEKYYLIDIELFITKINKNEGYEHSQH